MSINKDELITSLDHNPSINFFCLDGLPYRLLLHCGLTTIMERVDHKNVPAQIQEVLPITASAPRDRELDGLHGRINP